MLHNLIDSMFSFIYFASKSKALMKTINEIRHIRKKVFKIYGVWSFSKLSVVVGFVDHVVDVIKKIT